MGRRRSGGREKQRPSILARFQKSESLHMQPNEEGSSTRMGTAPTTEAGSLRGMDTTSEESGGGIRIIDREQMVSHLQTQNQNLQDRITELESLLNSKDEDRSRELMQQIEEQELDQIEELELDPID
eukprot:CAMPEP_0194039902 /NCGR_PEP_ID=MMETSP0009_2-20130614/11980_1 /TAXON_ID=210454 /ORGANISM="Grammatophora oceanica, Strain CCMP 410" /LENGTH=126 /DNA_ID=CAMNT_0038682869 /DNA_START=158 /DNA_END=538 /DNA_ORIENTATION=+